MFEKMETLLMTEVDFAIGNNQVKDSNIDKAGTSKSFTSRCRSDCRLLYFINYCYIISELRTKLKITSYSTKVDTVLYEIMDNEINNEFTISSLDKMIYSAIYEIRYRLSKRPDEKIIFSFFKEFLYGSEIAESAFWERLRTLEIKGGIVNKPSKKGNSFFLSKSNSYASVNSSDISYNQFPCSTPSCPQNLGHDLSIISEEVEALDKIINQSLQYITRDSTKECVSTETQTGGVSSTEYVDSGVGTNDDLFLMVANKGTETDSDCHQFIATLRETIFLLKDELRNKQVTIDSLMDVIKNFTVTENKYTRNKEQDTKLVVRKK